MKPLVYIAGPYTHTDPVENTNTAIAWGDQMVRDGIVTPIIPHLSLTWQLVLPQPYDFWIKYDLELLAHCQALFRFPGYSPGAEGEIHFARKELIPVFFNLSDLYTWAQPRD